MKRLTIALLAFTLINPLSVYANEETKSDRTNWLKQNLASQTSTTKCHIRPFVAHRHLPSTNELQKKLVAQQAHLDERAPDNSLTGQISAFVVQPDQTNYIAKLFSPANKKKIANRSIKTSEPEHKLTLADIKNKLKELDKDREILNSIIKEGATQTTNQMSAQAESLPTIKTNQNSFNQPIITADEKELLDELLKLNKPGSSSTFVDIGGTPAISANPINPIYAAPNYNSGVTSSQSAPTFAVAPQHRDIGPPPFPLNLLPEASLKEFVGHKQAKIDAPPAYFGSWHNTGNNLPQAGFRIYNTRNTRYINRATATSNTNESYTHPYVRPYSQYNFSKTASRQKSNTLSKQDSAESKRLVALYPPYGQ